MTTLTKARKRYTRTEKARLQAREAARKYYYANHENRLIKASERRNLLREQAANKTDDEKREHIRRRLLYCSRWRAKQDELEFNLTLDDIIIPACCPLLGIPLVLHYYSKTTKGPDMYAPSLDRIDSTKGYVKGNILVMSHRANSIKMDATLKELQTLVLNLQQYTS